MIGKKLKLMIVHHRGTLPSFTYFSPSGIQTFLKITLRAEAVKSVWSGQHMLWRFQLGRLWTRPRGHWHGIFSRASIWAGDRIELCGHCPVKCNNSSKAAEKPMVFFFPTLPVIYRSKMCCGRWQGGVFITWEDMSTSPPWNILKGFHSDNTMQLNKYVTFPQKVKLSYILVSRY